MDETEPTRREVEAVEQTWRQARRDLAADLMRETEAAETVRGDWLQKRLAEVWNFDPPAGYAEERVRTAGVRLYMWASCGRCDHPRHRHRDVSGPQPVEGGPCQVQVPELPDLDYGPLCGCSGFIEPA